MPERFDENFRSGLLHCNSLLGTPVLSVLAEYFHDFVFADKFEFLNSLHFHFFFGRKVMPVLEFCEFFFELLMLFIVFFSSGSLSRRETITCSSLLSIGRPPF